MKAGTSIKYKKNLLVLQCPFEFFKVCINQKKLQNLGLFRSRREHKNFMISLNNKNVGLLLHPELFFLLHNGVGELDAVGIHVSRRGPGQDDAGLLLGVRVSDGGLGTLLAALDVVADVVVDNKLADKFVALLGVNEEAFEGGPVRGLKLPETNSK